MFCFSAQYMISREGDCGCGASKDKRAEVNATCGGQFDARGELTLRTENESSTLY